MVKASALLQLNFRMSRRALAPVFAVQPDANAFQLIRLLCSEFRSLARII